MNENVKLINILSWNVRGLGEHTKCTRVRDSLTSSSPSIICSQESKLASLDMFKAASFLPLGFTEFVTVDADWSRGGLVTAWNPANFTIRSHICEQYTLTVVLSSTITNLEFTLTNVYAPADHSNTPDFLASLSHTKNLVTGAWVLAGYFNLVRSVEDKNNNIVSASLCFAFNSTIIELALIELPLLDRLFTWTNKRATPILARLDRVFFNTDMSSLFPNSSLTSLVRTTSDHTPLLLSLSTSIPKTCIFRFENAWLHHHDFLPTVLPAWHSVPCNGDAAGMLAASFKAVRCKANVWSKVKRAPPSIHQNCKFVIHLFDQLEEYRVLSTGEQLLRRLCQDRLELAIKERAAHWKQRGKFRRLCEDDTNTDYLHARATHRLHRNQIRCLEVGDAVLTAHADKTQAVTAHFSAAFAAADSPTWSFNLEDLYRNRCQIIGDQLTQPFTASEAAATIKAMDRTSAPGPDGFGPGFYQAVWADIEPKIMRYLSSFYPGEADMSRINRSYIVLLPKTLDARTPTAFRPICLQNCSIKLPSKILTTRLQRQIS